MALRLGGIVPTYWRRRGKQRWHRGMRTDPTVVQSQCGLAASSARNGILFEDINEPWPTPHCLACESATPGTDYAHADPGGEVSTDPPPKKT